MKKNLIVIASGLFVGVGIALCGDMQTLYSVEDGSPSVASATALFGPATGKTIVRSVVATCDKENGAVKFYARSGNKQAVSAVDATSVTCTVVNAETVIAAGDRVVYVFASGATPETKLVLASTTTSITLTNALSGTTGTGDYIYEVSQQGQMVVGLDGAGVGTNNTVDSSNCFATPSDSPLYCVLDGTSNAVLQVTVEK